MNPGTSLDGWKRGLRSLGGVLQQIHHDHTLAAPDLPQETLPSSTSSSSSSSTQREEDHAEEATTGVERGEQGDLVRNEIYTLIQLALQSGPLRGSDPGYFKRATTLPAHIEPALEFLRAVLPLVEGLGLSPKQAERVAKWLQDGEVQLQKKTQRIA